MSMRRWFDPADMPGWWLFLSALLAALVVSGLLHWLGWHLCRAI